MTAAMKAIVLTFDRLPVSFLGCYGHSQVATPAFDQSAAASVVFDQHFAENVAAAPPDHAWRTGCFHFRRSSGSTHSLPDVADSLARAGVDAALVVEEGCRTPLPDFRRVLRVKGRDGLAVPPQETPFAQLVAQAESLLAEWRPGDKHRLLWLHSRGTPSPWCPPREFARGALRRHMADEEDATADEPSPDEMAEPPEPEPGDADEPFDQLAETDEDVALDELPDEVFDELVAELVSAASSETAAAQLTIAEWQVARAVFAGYVELIDEGLGRLLSAVRKLAVPSPNPLSQGEGRVREADGEPLLFIVTAATGAAVGERGMMSLPATALPEEIVHTPLIVQAPGAEPGTRRQCLVQTVDLVPTLLEWFHISPGEQVCEGRSLLPMLAQAESSEREHICLGNGAGAAAIRTLQRYLIRGDETTGAPPRLFVKPDDVWEVNEVSAQSPDEADRLSATLAEFVERGPQGCR